MDQLIADLVYKINQKEEEIEAMKNELKMAENPNTVELLNKMAELNGLKDQLKILDTEENRKMAKENRQSVMDFITEEHKKQDEEDIRVQEGVQKLKEDIGAKEKFFRPYQAPKNESHSTQELANLIRNKVSSFFRLSSFHPTLEGTNTPFVIGNDSKKDIKFNQELLESHRYEITELLKVLAGTDYYHLGILKDGRPWANNEHDVEHLQAMATALGLVPIFVKPKIIEIEEIPEEEKEMHL